MSIIGRMSGSGVKTSIGGSPVSIKVRHSSLFDLDSIAPLGSRTWAEESRQSIQDALDHAVDGKVKFTDAMRYFWRHGGWKLLEDASGMAFQDIRSFALAKRPHGLHMSLQVFKAFMKDIGKATEEISDYAETHPLPEHGEIGGGHSRVDSVNSAKGGNSTDYLARRIARDRPDILERMKSGQYKSVRAAAKDAGIVREKTPIEQLTYWWKKASEEDRTMFLNSVTSNELLKGVKND